MAAVCACSGCGDDQPVRPSTAASATPAASVAADVAAFRARANEVCGVVRGTPRKPPGAGAPAAAVRAYATAPAKLDRSLAVSLRRLPAPAASKQEVSALAKTFDGLRRAHERLGEHPGSADQLAAARSEEAVAATRATAAGLPVCGGGPLG